MSEVERLMHVAWGECKEGKYNKPSWNALYQAVVGRHYPPASAPGQIAPPGAVPPDGTPSWADWLEERARAADGESLDALGIGLAEFYRGRAHAFREVAKSLDGSTE